MSWMMAAGTAISVGGSLLGGSSARSAQRSQDQAAEQRRLGMFNTNTAWSNEQLQRANEIRASGAYDPRYANVNNGFASTHVDPVTGNVSSSLNAPWANARDQLMGDARFASQQGHGMFDTAQQRINIGQGLEARGNDYLNQGASMFANANSFNPQSAADERYRSAQALLASGDAQAQGGLMQDLYSKGGFGLTLNQNAAAQAGPGGTVTAGQGTVGVNPYVNTFLNAQNQRNAGMAYQSLNEGQAQLDRLYGRAAGMNAQGGNMFNLGSQAFGQGMSAYGAGVNGLQASAGLYGNAGNIEGQTQNALNAAGNWSDRFNTNNTNYQNQYWNRVDQARLGNVNAQLGFFGAYDPASAGAGANNRSQMFTGMGNSIGGALMSGGMRARPGGQGMFTSPYGFQGSAIGQLNPGGGQNLGGGWGYTG